MVVGVYLRPIVILFGKTPIIQMLTPLRKLDKNNLFFRSEF